MFLVILIFGTPLCLDESGSRHKQMLDGRCSNQSQCRAKMTSSPRPTCRIKQRMGSKTRAVVGVSGRPFHCEMCQVSVNSETQLKQVCGFILIIIYEINFTTDQCINVYNA